MKNKFLTVIVAALIFFSSFLLTTYAAIQIGDVDADGKVSAGDARLALRYSVRLESLAPDAIFRADTDSNGLILANDARTILRISVGLAKSRVIDDQYDMIRCGIFDYKGERLDAQTGEYEYFELTRSRDAVHLLLSFEGVEIAAFIKNNTVYLVSHQKKMYLVTPDEVFSVLKLDKQQLLQNADFSGADYPPLSDAYSVKSGKVNGYSCNIYLIERNGGTIEVSMCGKKLIRVREYDKNGRLVGATSFYDVTMNIPDRKTAIPSNYKKYEGKTGALKFVGELLA